MAQTVKNPRALQETWVPSMGWEDSLEKGMAAHSGILAWRIPWTEEPGGLQPRGHKESDTTERLTLSHFKEEEQAETAKEEHHRAMFVGLKSTESKLHVEKKTNNSVQALVMRRRGRKKVFTKEMSMKQDSEGQIGIFPCK